MELLFCQVQGHQRAANEVGLLRELGREHHRHNGCGLRGRRGWNRGWSMRWSPEVSNHLLYPPRESFLRNETRGSLLSTSLYFLRSSILDYRFVSLGVFLLFLVFKALDENKWKWIKCTFNHATINISCFRYDTEQECEGAEECTGTWFTTAWTECTEACGGGTHSRKVSNQVKMYHECTVFT